MHNILSQRVTGVQGSSLKYERHCKGPRKKKNNSMVERGESSQQVPSEGHAIGTPVDKGVTWQL